MAKHTSQPIPLLIGDGYDHIMAQADILESHNSVTVNIIVTADGEKANDLVALLTSGEPQGLRFVAIPVTPPSTLRERE